MIADLKPYPAMKDSGVPWLGEVPAHWELPRLGAVLRERGETNDDGSVSDVLSVMKERGVIPYAEKGNVGNKRSDDITRYKVVRPDDIVVNCMNVIIGSVGLSRYTGCLSPVYYVLSRRSQTDDPRYLNAYFQTKPFQLSLVRIGNGILAHRMRIPMELLKCEPFPKPPREEQAAIVRFLDHADRRIKRYIRDKQKLIKLLEEQKQAIIHRAVTRGLDPNVRLKSSGVEWLGEVPEHWDVVQLRRRWEVVDCKHLTVPFVIEGVPLASVREVQSFELDLATSKRTTPEWHTHLISGRRVPKRGDLVYCRNVSVGACAFVNSDEQFAMGQDVCLIRSEAENGRFLNYFMHSSAMQQQLSLVLIGSTFNRINVSEIKSLLIAVPPRDEQDAIASDLDSKVASFENPIGVARDEISLLREYRTRLIADVVTGKLDVRAAAARLPDEADESEPLDDAEVLAEGDEETEGTDLDAVTEEAEA